MRHQISNRQTPRRSHATSRLLMRGYAWTLAAAAWLITQPAYAGPGSSGLAGIKGRIDAFNDQLILIGASLVVTGIIWAGLSITMGLAGGARAIIPIIAGLVISFAPQIAGLFIS